MNISIKSKEVKRDGQRYYIDFELTDYVNDMWEGAYEEALMQQSSFTSCYGSGCPTVNRITFDGDHAVTFSFTELAKRDLPEFLENFEKMIERANRIYESKLCLQRQREEAARRREAEENAKLDELNKFINGGNTNQDK